MMTFCADCLGSFVREFDHSTHSCEELRARWNIDWHQLEFREDIRYELKRVHPTWFLA